jgi:hypothetical protein
MVVYFLLQYKRLLRTLKDFGINPYLGFALGALAFFLLSNILFVKVAYSQLYYSLIALSGIFQLGEARRNEFLKTIYTKITYQNIRLLENLIIILPFAYFLIFKAFYTCALALIFLGLVCSFYTVSKNFSLIIPSPFHKRPFEFTTGFRKNFGIFAIIYAIIIIALSVNNFNLALLAYLSIYLVCLSFYSNAEPVFYVWVHSQESTIFLRNKIKTAVHYSLFVSLPTCILLTCFYPPKAFLIITVSLCGFLYVIISVVSKYANYPNQTTLLQSLIMSLGLVFPPLLLLLIPHFYFKSAKKLNTYLK